MIIFRVELQCDGCKTGFCGRTHDDPLALAELGSDLLKLAAEDGWAIDGAAQWCPKCIRPGAETAAQMEDTDRRHWTQLLERTPAVGGVQ